MHLFLIKKLAGMEADEIRREIHQRVELHISMFQAMGNRMPLAPRIAQLLTMLLEKYDAIAAGKPVNRAQLTFFSERLKEVFGFASWEEAIEVLSQRLGTQSYHVDMVRFISDALTS